MDLSSEDSSRTLDGVMHKDIIAQKRKLDCSWNGLSQSEAATILQLVNASIFMTVTYDDLMTGNEQTKTFYIGDRTAQANIWVFNGIKNTNIAFNFIEQ
jgi:hypothetical protein